MKKILSIITMGLMITQANAQFGVSVNYLAPTSSQKASLKNFLFLKQGWEVGANYIVPVAKKVGVKFEASYITGSSDEKQPAIYAKDKGDIIWSDWKPKPPKISKGFVIAGGPTVLLFMSKKVVLTLDVTAGALFSNKQTLQYLNQQGGVVREFKSGGTNFMYNPKVVLGIPTGKKMLLNFNAGYSSVGGVQVGLGISKINCYGAPCVRCPGWMCVQPPPPTPVKQGK